MNKYKVICIINNQEFLAIVDAINEAEAFCIARNKAEQYYHMNGVNLTCMEPITDKRCSVELFDESELIEIDEI